jgi:di/tricarboxylate transporter
MLAGVNIGGLGTPIASLASLITMKFYMRWPGARVLRFVGYFLAANVIALALLLAFVQII